MASTNRTKRDRTPLMTEEGGRAERINAVAQLERLVNTCLLFESSFYYNGVEISQAIREAVHKVKDSQEVARIAINARTVLNLRHAPLLVVREMARHPEHKQLVAETLEQVIQRADEITEFLALYWNVRVEQPARQYVRRGGRSVYETPAPTVKMDRQPVSAQVKKGLARAYRKFNAYGLARNLKLESAVKLRDVAFLCHFKPADGVKGFNRQHRAEVRKDLAKDEYVQLGTDGSRLLYSMLYGGLETPDTWETRLSKIGQDKNADKQAAWLEALTEGRLTGLGLLKNLRNLREAGVDKIEARKWLLETASRVDFPWRFIAAARYNPQWEDIIEEGFLAKLAELPKLKGLTRLVIDVSGSMWDHGSQLSGKSDLRRGDAACGLAVICREVCEQVEVFSFSNEVLTVPNRRGFALRDAITNSQAHRNTYLGRAVAEVVKRPYDRLFVFTDEQAQDRVEAPPADRLNYMINVGATKNGVGYGQGWTLHLDGFSEGLLRYIYKLEGVE